MWGVGTPSYSFLKVRASIGGDGLRKKGTKTGEDQIKRCSTYWTWGARLVNLQLAQLKIMLGREPGEDDPMFMTVDNRMLGDAPSTDNKNVSGWQPMTPASFSAGLEYCLPSDLSDFYGYATRDAGASLARMAQFDDRELALFLLHKYEMSMNSAYGNRMEGLEPTLRGMCSKIEGIANHLLGWWSPDLVLRPCPGELPVCEGTVPFGAKRTARFCKACSQVKFASQVATKERAMARIIDAGGIDCARCGKKFLPIGPKARNCAPCRATIRSEAATRTQARRARDRATALATQEAKYELVVQARRAAINPPRGDREKVAS